MFVQISIGAAILMVSMIFYAAGFWLIESALRHLNRYLAKLRQGLKVVIFLMVAALWALLQITVGVWIWAWCFMQLAVFETMEEAVYFGLVSYTTLGYGDVILPEQWRLLGGMTAVNGLLNVGLISAIMIELLRQARVVPIDD